MSAADPALPMAGNNRMKIQKTKNRYDFPTAIEKTDCHFRTKINEWPLKTKKSFQQFEG